MSDAPDPTAILRRYADSLRAAGVAWLPRTAPVALPPDESAPMSHEAPVDPLEARRHQLQVLTEAVASCTRCAALAATRTQTVFGTGPLDPDLCFIGEAPGEVEDATGQPFVGPAGQLLNRIIAACGMKREDVFICNILRCRPPGNRQPQAPEAANCREWLERTLETVRPRYICCLGATAAKFLLGINSTLGKMRKKFFDFNGIPVLCTYHPSWLLRLEEPAKTEGKREVWEDMKMLLAKMGRAIPGK
jgi:DNA polymerase